MGYEWIHRWVGRKVVGVLMGGYIDRQING